MSRIAELQEKVSAKFGSIHAKYKAEMRCGLGCHECCKPGLTVSQGEAALIKEYLLSRPEEKKAVENMGDPFQGKRCSFLSAEGACSIYPVRPLVCRSHGAPLQFRDPDQAKDENAIRFRDVCPLNFKNRPLEEIPPEDVLNLDTINTLLALVQGKETKRIPLRWKDIL